MKTCIRTQNLELRPLREADMEALEALLTNGEIKKTFMIPEFPDRERLRAAVEKLRRDSLEPEGIFRGILLHGTLIGFVNEVERTEGTLELGYAIHPEHQGRGYATEMLGAVLETLLSSGAFETVVAGAFAENPASIRVMEKCGMTRLPREEDIEYRGGLHHCVYYARSRGE